MLCVVVFVVMKSVWFDMIGIHGVYINLYQGIAQKAIEFFTIQRIQKQLMGRGFLAYALDSEVKTEDQNLVKIFSCCSKSRGCCFVLFCAMFSHTVAVSGFRGAS